jgi:glycosyltransferase involved in cell wall biosynthesis
MKKQDIICISMTTWEGDYMKTIVHMMSQLAKHHRVLFVDYAFTWKDLIYTILGKAAAPVRRMVGLSPALRRLKTRGGDEVYHLTLPPVIPINWVSHPKVFAFLLKWQVNPVVNRLSRVLHQLDFRAPVMINAFHPVMGEALKDRLEVSHLIYYCYDEIRAAQWAGIHGGKYEDYLIKKADAVIVTSEGLYEGRKDKNPHVRLIKNGVDFELFHSAYRNESHHVRPVIGYLGSVDDRLDYDLLEDMIISRPSWEFRFVGRVTYPAGQRRLSGFRNVTFYGAKQPDEIPQYLKEFDVGLIPFVTSEFTKNIYPLKINEYLAAGKPVVTTNFADLTDFASIAGIASDHESFVQMVEQSLEVVSNEELSERLQIAQSNGWENRAEQVENLLEHLDQSIHA